MSETKVAFVSRNHCLTAEVEETGNVSFFADFARGIYAKDPAAMSAANLNDPSPALAYRSPNNSPVVQVDFDFGEAKDIDAIAVLGHNVTTAGRIEVELSNDADFSTTEGSWGFVPTLDGVTGKLRHSEVIALAATLSGRYLRVTLADQTRDFLELGLVVAGEVVQPTYNVSFGRAKSLVDPSIKTRAQQSGVSVVHRQKYRHWDMPFKVTPEADVAGIFAQLANENGESVPVLVLQDWDTTAQIYGGDYLYGAFGAPMVSTITHPSLHKLGGVIVDEWPPAPMAGISAVPTLISSDVESVDFTTGDAIETNTVVEEDVVITANDANESNVTGTIAVVGSAYRLKSGESASFNLAAGESQTITVEFAPTIQGTDQAGTLTISHDASGSVSPIDVSLSGDAEYPPIFATLSAAYTNTIRNSLSNGSLTVTCINDGGYAWPVAYFAGTAVTQSAGKFYWEFTINDLGTGTAGQRIQIGFARTSRASNSSLALGDDAITWGLTDNGKTYINGSLGALTSALAINDVIGFALDLDNRKAWVKVNGSYPGGGDPVAGTSPDFTWSDDPDDALIRPCVTLAKNDSEGTFNFGATAIAAPTGFLPGWGTNLENL